MVLGSFLENEKGTLWKWRWAAPRRRPEEADAGESPAQGCGPKTSALPHL